MDDADVEFIRQSINGPLVSGLAEVANKRPTDPIQFLADWLYSYKNSQNESSDQELSRNEQASHESNMQSDINTFMQEMSLPESSRQTLPVDFPCLKSSSHGKWPIRNHSLSGLNVNAQHGGCAALLLMSNSYGGKGKETTGEIAFLRAGFDGNHYSSASIIRDNDGHFRCQNHYRTDESGELIFNSMFGTNHSSVISNNAWYGNLSHGIYIEGGKDGTEACVLPINVNGKQKVTGADGNQTVENGGGMVLVLCSGFEPGADGNQTVSASYAVRLGQFSDYMRANHISGNDKWKFSVTGSDETARLVVEGPNSSKYGIFHNRNVVIKEDTNRQAKVFHTQTEAGSQQTLMMSSIPVHAHMFVICSSSCGIEDATSAALYSAMLYTDENGKPAVKADLIKGLVGTKFSTTEVDLYSMIINDRGELAITGPDGPCKYSFISNLLEDASAEERCQQNSCLATGYAQTIRGCVKISDTDVIGWVTNPEVKYISLKVNEVPIATIAGSDLKSSNGRWAFHRKWKETEKTVGLRMVRIYAVMNCSKGDMSVELEGSPTQLILQPEGAIYALNCGGPAYQALNDLVYTSEHHQFAVFTNEFNYGSQYTCLGGTKPVTWVPQILTDTHDGFLYSRERNTYPEPVDEKLMNYVVNNLPDGDFNLRIHTRFRPYGRFVVNNDRASTALINSSLESKQVTLLDYTAFTVDIPVQILNNQLVLNIHNGFLSAFAVLEKDFKGKQMSEEELKQENKAKEELANKLEPLSRTFLKKKMTIVGWSHNLLQNASAELNNLSSWNVTGDWKVAEGGYGTEKSFQTSHMKCVKYQEVDLTETFDAEYLDSAPLIQVSEWYKEGVCGGGFYTLDVTLLDDDGQEIKKFSTGRIGTIYKNTQWQEATVTFSDYGPGVRRVAMESSGQDDKYWAGHYGPFISAAVIRVKRKATAAENDVFADVVKVSSSNESDEQSGKAQLKACDKVVAAVLSKNKDILDSISEENARESIESDLDLVIGKTKFELKKERKVMKKRRKREIRVFVSSTFRDFINEREQLIKKTFRELNKYCVDRGVFFSYVDLRWGITEEQTNHGQTIAICLKEIEHCDYFVCLMGERFGWSQTQDSPDELLNNSFDYAIENHHQLEWLKENRFDTSVTQLEIMYGVLNDVDKAKGTSFFYLRDPVKQESLDPETYKKMCSESDWHKSKQEQLREKVKNQPLHIRRYEEVNKVTEMIKKDLMRVVDQDFPLGTELTPLEREREAHLAFAEARRRVYIGGEEYFRQIDEFVTEEKDVPLVILGESGSGKSSLVANWVSKFEEKTKQECFLFYHFIGSSAESASYIKLLRRLYSEMKAFFGFGLEVPTNDTVLVQDLSKWLHLAGHSTQCVIVLDALNQLDDGSGTEGAEHDLLWIPKQLPPGVIMILSTLPGRAYEAAKTAGWPTLTVKPLDLSHKSQIITGYMEGIYRKSLSNEQKKTIVDAPQTNNPLYLKAFLDELRLYGSFRKLSEKISDYLSADTPKFLFAKILERLEEDFEQGLHVRPGLVKETTCALWCSHRGMTEAELIDYLQVPSPVWSPFYLSLIENLVNRNGIVNFFHDHLRQAVEAKYLPTPEDKQASYKKLAEFFYRKELDDRVVQELPYLLAKAGDLEKLKEIIIDLEVFKMLIKTEDGKFDLITSWKIIGGLDQAEAAYMEKLKQVPVYKQVTAEHGQLVADLAQFFVDIGLLNAARDLFETLLKELEENSSQELQTIVYSPHDHSRTYRSKDPAVLDVLYNLGRTCEKQGELKQGLKYYTDAVVRQNRIQTPAQKLQLVEGLLGMATVQTLMEDMKEAKKCLIRSREIATDVLGERHHYVTAVINKLGQLAYRQSLLDEAKLYLVLDLSMTRGDVGVTHPRTAGILNDLALLYDDQGDLMAGQLYEAAIVILINTYGTSHMDIAYVRYNLGAFYFATNYFARAKFQFEEAYRIFLLFVGPDHKDTQDAKVALDDVSGMIKS